VDVKTGMCHIQEEHKLGMFKNMEMRKMLGLKRNIVTGDWQNLHTEELQDWYSSTNIIIVVCSVPIHSIFFYIIPGYHFL
jgi:hypothetical protein